MIEVEELTYRYPESARTTLQGLSFAVDPGEIFGFLGPNGAGKSTTQKVLTGLLGAYGGRVRVLGREVREWGSDLYEQVGVGFELPIHYGRLTARENLAYFSSLYAGETADIDRLLRDVDLFEHADMRVEQFSKGMRVRLSFARAVLCQPKLLFLDEPTTGLDPVSAARLKALIQAHRERGATIFLTTHDMTAADELCDRVAFIVDGHIALIDSPRSLKVEHGEQTVRVEHSHADGVRAESFSLEGLSENSDFLAALARPGLQTIHSQETTLDQIFIRVTGTELR